MTKLQDKLTARIQMTLAASRPFPISSSLLIEIVATGEDPQAVRDVIGAVIDRLIASGEASRVRSDAYRAGPSLKAPQGFPIEDPVH